MKLGLQLGYWGAQPPEGVADTTMPANLTPEYKAAEAAFRKARDPSERLELLRPLRHLPALRSLTLFDVQSLACSSLGELAACQALLFTNEIAYLN